MNKQHAYKKNQQTTMVAVGIVCAIVIIFVNIAKHVSALTWALTIAIMVIGSFGEYRRLHGGKKWNGFTTTATVLLVMVLFTACAPTYSADPGPPTKPAVVGMQWATSSSENECALGLAIDGTTFVATFTGHPVAAFGIEWLGWVVLGDSAPLGGSLINCWNESQRNWHSFNLYTQCYGQPVVKNVFDDIGKAQAYVSIPSCVNCNQACQASANQVEPWRVLNSTYCNTHYNPYDIYCWPSNGFAPTQALPQDQSLADAGFDPAAWNTDIPAPLPQ